jgi:hypothetical protein
MRPSETKMEGTRYTIVVRGRLSERFALAFPEAVVEAEAARTSLLIGPFDQSQLSGFLQRLGSFGLELISVEERTSAQGSDHEKGTP